MHAPLTAGTMVAGRYRVEAPIGEGGHGMVYRAADTSVGRAVALKMLHRGMPAAGNLEARFQQEARLARQLQHPNTVRLLDFGRTDDGSLYIAYELLNGVPMDQALRAGRMPPERVAHIGTQLLKSLMEAHQHGVVHRDIKPSNVFLCSYSGEPDFVKVLDFGIAKSVDVERQLTRTGFVVGTPSYMAPEQVRGDTVGPATDIYAVGLLLAEALTGAVIVLGNTDAVTAAAQLSPDPVPLPPEVLQSPLGPVIHRATQKPLERRYSSSAQISTICRRCTSARGHRATPSRWPPPVCFRPRWRSPPPGCKRLRWRSRPPRRRRCDLRPVSPNPRAAAGCSWASSACPCWWSRSSSEVSSGPSASARARATSAPRRAAAIAAARRGRRRRPPHRRRPPERRDRAAIWPRSPSPR